MQTEAAITAKNSELTPADVLEVAAALLSVPGAWCRGQAAFAADRKSCHAWDDEAISWCALGATVKAANSDAALYQPAQRLLARHLGVREISIWNDAHERTQAEVVAALRAAAKQSASQKKAA